MEYDCVRIHGLRCWYLSSPCLLLYYHDLIRPPTSSLDVEVWITMLTLTHCTPVEVYVLLSVCVALHRSMILLCALLQSHDPGLHP